MADFSQDIQNFQRYGTYTYEFDSVGNMVFNTSSADFSQVYVSFGLNNFVYDDGKIASFYNPTFTEFIPAVTSSNFTQADVQDLQNQLDTATTQSLLLQDQLNQLIAVNETTQPTGRDEATKQVILELRESLGQGRVESDFSTDFPYAPMTKTQSISSQTTGSNSS